MAQVLDKALSVFDKLLGYRDFETTARYSHLARVFIHEGAERHATNLVKDFCVRPATRS